MVAVGCFKVNVFGYDRRSISGSRQLGRRKRVVPQHLRGRFAIAWKLCGCGCGRDYFLIEGGSLAQTGVGSAHFSIRTSSIFAGKRVN